MSTFEVLKGSHKHYLFVPGNSDKPPETLYSCVGCGGLKFEGAPQTPPFPIPVDFDDSEYCCGRPMRRWRRESDDAPEWQELAELMERR